MGVARSLGIAGVAALLCGWTPGVAAGADAPVDPTATSEWACGHWGMYGAGLGRSFSNDCPTGISPTTAATLVPAWFFKTDRSVTASPVVVDGVLYVGDWSGTMYALDAATGAERWRFQVPESQGAAFGPVVSSAAVTAVELNDTLQRLVIFGGGPHLFALDAVSGQVRWQLDLLQGEPGERNQTEILSSPAVSGGVVYVGLDTHGHSEADTGGVRGGLLAVDAATGIERWRFEPELDQPGVGCGGVWSSPVVDVADGLVVFATANCGEPAEDFTWNDHTEAVTALRMDDGAVAWTFSPHDPNRLDIDFGATPNLFTDADGRRLLGAGDKNAVYYAVDPATGIEQWNVQVAEPGNFSQDFAVGGFIGSPATWNGTVVGATAIGGNPYVHAIDGRTGDIAWQSPAAPPSYAATGIAGGVAFVAALDSVVRGFDVATGLPVFAAPLAGPGSSGPAIVGDWLFIGSGTSSTDLCAKGSPGDTLCLTIFESLVGGLGGVHGFHLAASTNPPTPAGVAAIANPPASPPAAAPAPVDSANRSASLPATGGAVPLAPAAVALAAALLARHRAMPKR